MGSPHILVVEDDPNSALILTTMLHTMGCTTDVVTSGEAAVHQTAVTPPSLVLMDIVLPGAMDGIHAAQAIWQRQHIPIVYVTAHAEDTLLKRAARTNPFGYLLKPFTERELFATVQLALYTAEAETALQVSEERSHRLEEQLRQAQRMESVGLLTSGIAHDFKNTLMEIIGYGELALRALPADALVRSDVQELLAASGRAAALAQQLLTFSRHQVGERQRIDVNDVVTDLERMLKRLVHTMVVQTILEPSLGMIEAAPSQVDQVIMNLVVNARDAMPQGGTLTVETANIEIDAACSEQHPVVPPGAYICLSVRDTGCGMDAATLAHVFEPFFTTKPVGHGTGLGLSTVYGIVREWRGAIEVRSDVGRGTTFDVYIPRPCEITEPKYTTVALEHAA
ncbi:MAG TPA: response regulator [Gemmatimonadaceae bacterium]|jgi:signal transduction histidine kinase|nr:response regulator [Gemmatimonadaceae bacterium]